MNDFNPQMLRLARVARGRKQTDVAEQVGLKQPTYSKFENGNLKPNPEQVARIAEELHFPVAFFMQTDRIWGTASPHHRKRKSLSVLQQEQLEAQLNIVRMHVRRLTSSVHIEPYFDVPTIDLDQVGSPAEAARYVRQLWRVPMGPIDNMVRLLEDAGVIIVPQPFPSDKVDAISIWGPGEHPVVFLNSTFPVDRRRRTLAHELGHLVLHASDVTEDPEAEADAFASEFLLPEAEIKHELAGLKLWQLADLKRRWKGAMRSFVYRAQELGQISKDQARYLYMRLNQKYGAKYEPIELPEEQPELMTEIVQQHLGDLGYSIEQLALIAVSETDDFEVLYGPWRRRLHAL
jgi:Zn-dependent peptidase ImmA (M78 family)/DNA-binding XRE family transcriptional regulator